MKSQLFICLAVLLFIGKLNAQDSSIKLENLRLKCFYTDERSGRNLAPIKSGDNFSMYVYKKVQDEDGKVTVTNNCYNYKFGISSRYRVDQKTYYHVEAYSWPVVCGTGAVIEGINQTGKGADVNIIYPKEYFDKKYVGFKDLTDVIMTIKDAANDAEFEKIKKEAIKEYIEKNKINFSNLLCYLYDVSKEPDWSIVKN